MTSDSNIAAICFSGQQTVDHTLQDVVRQLKAEGVSVCGYIQKEMQQPGNCCSTIFIEDIASGSLQCISQALGPGSRGCRLDTAAMAAAAGSLLAQVGAETDLLIVNRFGKGEAEGGGLRVVIEEAVSRDISVLVGVRETYLEDWIDFAGDDFFVVPANVGAVLHWCRTALSPSTIESVSEVQYVPNPNSKSGLSSGAKITNMPRRKIPSRQQAISNR